jgi:hypothetical protein
MIHTTTISELPDTIRCLGVADEVDRPERNDPMLRAELLAGRLQIRRGLNIWWLDEDMQQHFARVEHGEKMPRFELITKLDFTVTVTGIGEFEVTQSRNR